MALLGGTFNPPHIGHLLIASAASEQFGLKRVSFLPARIPPHKQYRKQVSDSDRLEMLKRAIGDDSRFDVLDIELAREGISYTIITVEDLRRSGIRGRIPFIIGDDQLPALCTWKAFERLREELLFLVAPRSGAIPDFSVVPDGVRYERLESVRIAVSSSEIRDRVASGRSIRYLVPDPVRDMILKEGFYK